jgi:hypothetical protein
MTARADRSSDARGRTYLGPDGTRWPSFTTLTGLVPGKAAGLTAWRKRVGDAAADAVLAESIAHGNRTHDALELGDGSGPPEVERWLARNFAVVYGRELTLADSRLRAAGTADLVGLLADGRVAVLDWKTGARRPEHALQVVGYGDCDLALGPDGAWELWTLDVDVHLVGYIDRDGGLSVQVARADDATRSVLAGLRASWDWYSASRGALRAWKEGV